MVGGGGGGGTGRPVHRYLKSVGELQVGWKHPNVTLHTRAHTHICCFYMCVLCALCVCVRVSVSVKLCVWLTVSYCRNTYLYSIHTSSSTHMSAREIVSGREFLSNAGTIFSAFQIWG